MKIIICQGTPVVPSRMLDRITDQAEFFIRIDIGLHYVAGSASIVAVKRKGQVVHEERIPASRIPNKGLMRLLRLPFIHLGYVRLILRALKKWPEARESVFIGRHWLCCCAGLLGRKLGRVRKVAYWMGDYFPRTGSIESRIYQFVNAWVTSRADEVWYGNRRMMEVNTAPDGRRMTSGAEKLVPILYDAHPEVHGLWKPENMSRFLYVGYVQESQGIMIALEAVAAVRNELPAVKLDVIGRGPDLDRAIEHAGRLGIKDRVVFHGFVADESEIHRIAAQCAAGLAIYDPVMAGHAKYTVNSKVFMYIGCGVPVIITSDAGSCDFVMDGNAGVKVDYTVASLVGGMKEMSRSLEKHLRLREAARIQAAGFDNHAAILEAAVKGLGDRTEGR